MVETTTEKASGRTSTLLSAKICWAAGESAAFVRNISEMGALLECDAALEPKQPIILKRGDLEVHGCVVWAKDETYGIKFATTVDPAAWLGELGPKTAVVAATSSLKRLIEEGKDVSSLIDKRISEEIAYVARMLENVGEAFSKDAVLCNRYAAQLQNISISIQMLKETSAVVSSDDKISAVKSQITGPMKTRVLR